MTYIIFLLDEFDNIMPERNEAYSNALFAFLKDKFGLQGDRGYM